MVDRVVGYLAPRLLGAGHIKHGLDDDERTPRVLQGERIVSIRGKAVTPFLLGYIVEASEGRSLEVNLDLARNNVSLAADIAIAWSKLGD